MTELSLDSRVKEIEQIKAQRPDAQVIDWVAAGDINDIAIVDNKEVFRFPRDDLGKQQLAYEFELLAKLRGKTTLNIPEPTYIDSNSQFGIVQYIPGNVISDADIRALPQEKQEILGKDLAVFIKELNSGLDAGDVKHALRLIHRSESWDEWHDSMLTIAAKNGSKYEASYKRFLGELKQAFPKGFDAGDSVIHDDLHGLNMIFTPTDELTGIIDFGDLRLGDIHRELRPIYRMGANVLSALIKDLGSQFGGISIEAIHWCAVVHEVAVVIDHENKGTPNSRRAKYADRLLSHWLGESWGEL